MEQTYDVWMNGKLQAMTKKEIAKAYAYGTIKPLGFVGESNGVIRNGFDVVYWSGIYIVVVEVTTHRVYVTKMIYEKSDIKFKVDGERYSIKKQGVSFGQ